jgi:hypothetical protein
LLFWLNPAVLWNDHAWPQRDVWLVPFFLFAALFASMNRWLLCGAMLAIGTLFKGQILLVAPMFILWPLFMRRWLDATLAAGGLILTLALCSLPWLTHGSIAWIQIGLAFGSHKFHVLSGHYTSNLPALLAHYLHWDYATPLLQSPLLITPPLLLKIAYFLSLIACSFAAARQAGKNNPRFLIALVAPWVFFFLLLPQMNCRYLFWGAALTALLPGASYLLTGFGLIICAANVSMMATVMYYYSAQDHGWRFFKTLESLHPYSAWAILLIAAAYLAIGMRIKREKVPRAISETEFEELLFTHQNISPADDAPRWRRYSVPARA